MRNKFITILVGGALYLVGLWTVPHWWCGRQAGAWFHGDANRQGALARGVEHWVSGDLGRADFQTGSRQFNGEWLFGTYQMAGLGFGQTAREHPEWRARHMALMERCIERLLSDDVRAFDRETWGDDPLATLDGPSHHAAYLGYLNLLLSLHRQLEPHSKFSDWNDRITAALARRLADSPIGLVQSYPGEVYPVDNSAVVGSIGLYDRATGADHRALLQSWARRCRQAYLDRASGLLYQCVDPQTGKPVDDARGSGTALAVYFLSFADPVLSRELFTALRRNQAGTVLGFGAVREYSRTAAGGRGDIDSGPVVLGYGVSATGFALAGARMYGDAQAYRQWFSTAYLVGAPACRQGRCEFVMVGPLGNAILFAMLTAQTPGEVTR